MFADSYKLKEQRPDYLVNLERKAQRTIDHVKNLEANIENVDWHEFEMFEDMLEKARIESIEAQRAYNYAFLEWSHSQIDRHQTMTQQREQTRAAGGKSLQIGSEKTGVKQN